MPTYDYKCEKCQKEFEVFQSITADPITECIDQECDGKVTKLISKGSGFVLKGSGFYQTDYKSKTNSNESCGSKEECSSCPAAQNK